MQVQTPTHSTSLSEEELLARRRIEERIRTRSPGRIADGRDLREIRDRGLYRDHGTFEAYIETAFGVVPGSAYRWMDAATVIDETIQAASPKGETEAPVAWALLMKHRNETVCRKLAEYSAEERWKIYQRAVLNAKGHEPKPKHMKLAAQHLGLLEAEKFLDGRTMDRTRARQLILSVRDAAKASGRKLWATKLDDALHRLRLKR